MIPSSTKLPGSIYDVARRAGVSIGTVSRVFNNKQDVAHDTRTRVLDAAKRVRYLPKVSARKISIGVVVQEIESANQVGFVSNMVSTLAKQIAVRGAVLELLPIDDLDAVYRNYLRGLIAIVFGAGRPALSQVKDVPVVTINNWIEGANFHMVGSDHAQGARMAAKHLLDRGHRRIGFLEVKKDNWGAKERERGFREAFEATGLKAPADLVCYVNDRTQREAVLELLAAKPTAMLICGEDLSLAANQILLHEAKVQIPAQLSVISYETPLVSALLSPPQTAVSQPWEEIARQAVDTILSAIRKGPSKPTRQLFPNVLIERDSVKNLR